MAAVVEVSGLRAYYRTDAYGVRRTVRAVDGVSLEVRENEVFGIAGESGCGKSTLLKVMLGIVVPPLTVLDGQVWYAHDGQFVDVLTMPEEERDAMRWREASYIPQGSMHVLNPVRRIRHTFGDFVAAHRKMGRREADDLVHSYVRDLGLSAKVLDAYPHQLSGGMRQRVTVALATILRPRIVFADEPTTALDVVVQRGVIQLLKDVQQRERNTLVIVTHDMGVHANLDDRTAVLYAGMLIEEAPTRAIFKQPLHPYTQFLIRSLPALDDRSERVSIPGTPPALDAVPPGCRFHPRCPYAMEICTQSTPELLAAREDHRVACFLVGRESP
ncbi:MAG: ABC transporter ATP-binding protein [Chloroflexi bacterium]|nr:ABC transporter ATP-binding protein [Chloroflexota bacterium]